MLLREASVLAIKRSKDEEDVTITMDDFMKAMKKVFPSVSKQDEMVYNKLKSSLKKSRAHLEEDTKI